MRVFKGALLVFALVTTAAAQSPAPPLAETRLTVHTLLREDIFAGFFDNNMDRVSRAEQNIELLLKQRPDERANLLAWKGGAALQRAVRANETGKPDEFARYFQDARDAFAAAAKLTSGNDGVPAITGGSYGFFGDRLPQEHRAAAWAQAYDSYSTLWKQQGQGIDQLPLHFKGELLSGMAQSAQRTGRSEEAAQFVDRLLTMLANTPFEKTARQWKTDPSSVATTNLTCKNCHSPGRLSARLAALTKGD
jgi:hypothetical protein